MREKEGGGIYEWWMYEGCMYEDRYIGVRLSLRKCSYPPSLDC